MPTTPSNLIPITLAELQQAVHAPIGYVRDVIHKLFNISSNDPLPDTLNFFEQVEFENGIRWLSRNQDSLTIGVNFGDNPVTKASILAYVAAATPNVQDVSIWTDVEIPAETEETQPA